MTFPLIVIEVEALFAISNLGGASSPPELFNTLNHKKLELFWGWSHKSIINGRQVFVENNSRASIEITFKCFLAPICPVLFNI